MHKIIMEKGLLYLFKLSFVQQEADGSRKKILYLFPLLLILEIFFYDDSSEDGMTHANKMEKTFFENS